MARAQHVCAQPDCPELTTARHCAAHARTAEQARGTRRQRGYDRVHDRLRRQWKPKVVAGLVNCARCGGPIHPGQEWALDHTDDRAGYLGPSHKTCNNSAGGKAAHR